MGEPEDEDNHNAKGDTSIQSVSRIFADTSVGYSGPKPAGSPMNKPNILQVAEAPMYCSPPEALFNHHTHHQIEVKNTSAPVCITTSHQKYDSWNSNPSLKDSNIKNSIAFTEIGNSLLSIDTASTSASTSASFDSSINNRRNHFRKMKSEESSLPSIMTEIDNSLNEDEILKESLVSIEMDSLKSIDIRSIDMESYTMSLQDKASFIDLDQMVCDSDQCSIEDLLSDEQITGHISAFDSVIGVSRPVFPV